VTAYGLPMLWILPWLFLFGAVIGSWLNVCVYRIPRHERLLDQLRGITNPPSSCPRCKNRIRWYDNIPIIGWIKLGGRCRFCRGRISARYPIIEFVNGLIFAGLYWYEIPEGWSAKLSDAPFFPLPGFENVEFSRTYAMWLLHGRYLYHLVLIEALLVASLIDFDLKIIPDATTVPATIVGILGAFIGGWMFLVPVWWQDPSMMRQVEWLLQEAWNTSLPISLTASQYPQWIDQHPHWHGLACSLAGFAVGWCVVLGVRWIGNFVLRQEAMGFGDVVLMGMIGSFLGWQPTLVVFFIAPLCALTVVILTWIFRPQWVLPFGPYLALGAVIVLFGWDHIWPSCSRIFDLGILLPPLALFAGLLLAAALFVVQAAKRALGISTVHQEWVEEWKPADQLMHYAGNKVDEQHRFKRLAARRDWPGTSAARGTLYDHRWRNSNGHR
jgi:leader peptidase (prepilin peptidase)/N-methyltransferase